MEQNLTKYLDFLLESPASLSPLRHSCGPQAALNKHYQLALVAEVPQSVQNGLGIGVFNDFIIESNFHVQIKHSLSQVGALPFCLGLKTHQGYLGYYKTHQLSCQTIPA